MSNDKKEVIIITDGLRGADILEYNFGTPIVEDSKNVVELQGNWRERKWFIAFGLVGGLITALIIFVLGLLAHAIQINAQWFVNLF